MKKYTVILDRRNERKTITVEAMSYPGARNSAREQFPEWEIWLVKDASPSPLADAVEIARGAPPTTPVRFSHPKRKTRHALNERFRDRPVIQDEMTGPLADAYQPDETR